MALGATVYKAQLQLADMDRHHYQDYALTLAQHPSETELRLMTRLAVFALNADEQLAFTKGISTEDEPDLWQKSLSGDIELWIDLGQPDEKRIRRACGRGQTVRIYCYGGRSSQIWWEQNQGKLSRFKNLSVYNLPEHQCQQLAALCQRSMALQASIQDGELWLSSDAGSVQLTPERWQA